MTYIQALSILCRPRIS